MKTTDEEFDASGAALVCAHVASRAEPIRIAFRIEPSEPVDSGWQFFCGVAEEEDAAKARVWSLTDVLEEEFDLRPYLTLPPGTELVRKEGTWIIRA
jgi:hypothetical protein